MVAQNNPARDTIRSMLFDADEANDEILADLRQAFEEALAATAWKYWHNEITDHADYASGPTVCDDLHRLTCPALRLLPSSHRIAQKVGRAALD